VQQLADSLSKLSERERLLLIALLLQLAPGFVK